MNTPYASLGIFLAITFVVIYIALYSVSVWLILTRWFPSLSRLEKISVSGILSIMVSSWISFCSWYVFGSQIGTLISVILPIVWVSLKYSAIRNGAQRTLQALKGYRRRPSTREWWIVAFASIVILTCAWLAYTHFLLELNNAWISAGNTWADLALHMTLASHFVVQGVSNLSLPIFPDARLTYPFLIDLHAAQLYVLSHNWQLAFGVPSFLLIVQSTYLLYRIAFRITGSKRAGALWILLILCSGSAAGVITLWRDVIQGAVGTTKDYSHLFVGNALSQEHFANFMTSHLLPQRSYALGFGVFTSVFLMISTIFESTKRQRMGWIILGCVIGLLPFAHVHTYLVCMGLLGLLVLYSALEKIPHASDMFLAVIIAITIGLPQIVWQFGGSYHSGFSYWHFGWLTPESSNIIQFWWINLGLLCLFIPLSIWHIKTYKSKPLLWLYLIEAVIIFTACNLYIFQPSEWDNMKFLTYSYVACTLPVAWTISSFWMKSNWNKVAAATALIIILAPGVQSIYLESTVRYTFLSRDDLALASYVSTSLPTDATILTTDRHNHPISTLTGRPIVMGFRGWLSSYGIAYSDTEMDIKSILSRPSESEPLIKKHQIRYIILSDDEMRNNNISQSSFDSAFTPVFNTVSWYVWETKPY